jgi:hypothetical protein
MTVDNIVHLNDRRKVVSNNGFHWLHRHLKEFDISLEPYHEELRFKAFVELAFLLCLYKRKFKHSNDSIIKLITFVKENLLNSSYIERLMRTPRLIIGHAWIHYALCEHGIELDS